MKATDRALIRRHQLKLNASTRLLVVFESSQRFLEPLVDLLQMLSIDTVLSNQVRTLERLPGTLADLERAAADLATDGLKLHPETIKAFGAERNGEGVSRWALWIALAALAVAVAAVL